jgi:hypothetical protein
MDVKCYFVPVSRCGGSTCQYRAEKQVSENNNRRVLFWETVWIKSSCTGNIMGLVLPSETWCQSGGVHHCFERIITGEQSLILDEMMMMVMMMMTTELSSSYSDSWLPESVLTCVWKHVGRLLVLWCVSAFAVFWQLFLSTNKRTYQHREAAFITCISDTEG